MIKKLFFLLIMTFSLNALAFFDGNQNVFDQKERLLSAKEAFQPDVSVEGGEIELSFNIQQNYHIYSDQLIVKVNDIDSIVTGGTSINIDDEFFGKVDVFRHFNKFSIENKDVKSEKLNISVNYQGCASKLNVCYPVEYYNIVVDNPIYDKDYVDNVAVSGGSKEDVESFDSSDLDLSSSTSISSYLMGVSEGNMFLVFVLAFVGGVLVAFTPCIYPMIPIITGIVVSNKKDSPLKLTSFYVLGIALCYASIFAALELFNINIQSLMMNNITSFITSVVLILLSFVVIGFLGFQMPSGFQTKVNSMNDKLANKGAVAMIPSGYLSALILSPCATAPLAGVLLFASALSASYGLIYGVSLVFMFGLGVGFPIILITTYFKKYMPKNGNWMNVIKMAIGLFIMTIGFGLLLGSMSEYIRQETIDIVLSIFTVGVLSYFTILCFKSFIGNKINVKLISFFVLISAVSYSIYTIDDTIRNNTNSGTELSGFDINEWVIVDGIDEMMSYINNGNKTIVFVSADWCVICDKLKKTVLSSDIVIGELKDYNKIYVDITKRGKREDILDFYGMKLAPYFTFYSSEGELHNNDKFVGYLNEDRFLSIISDIK